MIAEMENWYLRSSEAGELELAPYSKNKAWVEISNTEQSGFFVMTREDARMIAEKLLDWADAKPLESHDHTKP